MTLVTATEYTAEEFMELADVEGPVELSDGRINQMPPPFPRHGQICAKLARLLGNFAEPTHGHVMSNDVCIVTKRNPDTVRGADVAYISYLKVPKGPIPDGLLPAQPDLIVEVRSPDDRWKVLMENVVEYLNAGTPVVCVVDPTTETAVVYRPDGREEQFTNGDDLKFEDVLPGFSVPLKQLFE